MAGPDPMTPEWSRELAVVRTSPYWEGRNDGMAYRDTFVDQAAQYATYDDMPGDLKAIFQAAQDAAERARG